MWHSGATVSQQSDIPCMENLGFDKTMHWYNRVELGMGELLTWNPKLLQRAVFGHSCYSLQGKHLME